MSDVAHPALSAAEWNGVLHQKDGLAHLREEFGKLPFSSHAIAAHVKRDVTSLQMAI